MAMKSIDFQLVIAGCGALEKKLKKLVVDLSITHAVTFTGFIPDEDLPNLYCLADSFIMAGTAELQSIATMEAMASALPILAVDAVALPELIKHGENGFLFPAMDISQLTKYIEVIFTNEPLRKTMAQKSLEFISVHSIDKVMHRFVEIYRNLVSIDNFSTTPTYLGLSAPSSLTLDTADKPRYVGVSEDLSE